MKTYIYGGRYGVVEAIQRGDGPESWQRFGTVYQCSAIDLLAQGIEPRPLYSERRRMEAMSPVRLGLHLIIRAAYWRTPNNRLTRLLWRWWRG